MDVLGKWVGSIFKVTQTKNSSYLLKDYITEVWKDAGQLCTETHEE